MQFELDRADDPAGEPSIAQMTEKAIEILSKNKEGYFLMVEGIKKISLYFLLLITTSIMFEVEENHFEFHCTAVVQNKGKFRVPTDLPRNLFCITGNINSPLCFIVIICFNSLNVNKFG